MYNMTKFIEFTSVICYNFTYQILVGYFIMKNKSILGNYYKSVIEYNCHNCNYNVWKVCRKFNQLYNLQCAKCYSIITVSPDILKSKFRVYRSNNNSANNTRFTQHKLTAKDVLVISDLRRCSNKKHHMEDVKAIIRVSINNQIQIKTISACFCYDCCRYTISENEYNSLGGEPVCDIKWHNNKSDCNEELWDFNTQHSILYKLGYNVQKQSGLSADVRRKILTDIIKNRRLSKSQVCSYLEMFIKQKRSQLNMQDAVSKWRSDLQYIRNLKINTSETIEVKKLIKR